MGNDPNRGRADAAITEFLLGECGRLGEFIDAEADELRWLIKERNPRAKLSKSGAVELVVKTLLFAESR